MLEFANPYCFLLLLLPFSVRFLSAYRHKSDSVFVSFFSQLQKLSGERPKGGAGILSRDVWQRILLPLTWVLLVTASARPEWVGEPIVKNRSARDLMVAVDLSGSMATKDFVMLSKQLDVVEEIKQVENNVDRLTAVKLVLTDFSRNRNHDRLGLIVFGDAPYLQVPFTEDHTTWLALLNETEVAMAGQSTVIGDAIGLAIKHFEKSEVKNKTLIVLTDGNDTGSKVPPIEAARIAQAYNIKIYCIAIGDPASVGEEAIDENTLKRVAELTGGSFYHAFNPQELSGIYHAISELEPELFETLIFQPRSSLHFYLIILLLLLHLTYFLTNLAYVRKGGEALSGSQLPSDSQFSPDSYLMGDSAGKAGPGQEQAGKDIGEKNKREKDKGIKYA